MKKAMNKILILIAITAIALTMGVASIVSDLPENASFAYAEDISSSILVADTTHEWDGTAKAVVAYDSSSHILSFTIVYSQLGVPIASPTDIGSYDYHITGSSGSYTCDVYGVMVISPINVNSYVVLSGTTQN